MPNSFTWQGATISANADLTIGDEDRINTLLYKLPEATILANGYRFAEFMIASQIDGEIDGLPMVTDGDDKETIAASFEAWRTLPRKFGKQWQSVLSEADNTQKKAAD